MGQLSIAQELNPAAGTGGKSTACTSEEDQMQDSNRQETSQNVISRLA